MIFYFFFTKMSSSFHPAYFIIGSILSVGSLKMFLKKKTDSDEPKPEASDEPKSEASDKPKPEASGETVTEKDFASFKAVEPTEFEMPLEKDELLEKVESSLEEKDKKEIIVFKADWCGACKAFESEIVQCKNKYPELKLTVYNVDKDKEVSKEYKIQYLPTVIYMKNGKSQSKKEGYHQMETQIQEFLH